MTDFGLCFLLWRRGFTAQQAQQVVPLVGLILRPQLVRGSMIGRGAESTGLARARKCRCLEGSQATHSTCNSARLRGCCSLAVLWWDFWDVVLSFLGVQSLLE
jgi:hypothetical protein